MNRDARDAYASDVDDDGNVTDASRRAKPKAKVGPKGPLP